MCHIFVTINILKALYTLCLATKMLLQHGLHIFKLLHNLFSSNFFVIPALIRTEKKFHN